MSFFLSTLSPLDLEEDKAFLNNLAASNSNSCKSVSTDGSNTAIWFPDGNKFYSWVYPRDFSFTIIGRRDLISSTELTNLLDWLKPGILPGTQSQQDAGNGYQVPDHTTPAKGYLYGVSNSARSPLDNQGWFINMAYELFLKTGTTTWYNSNKVLLNNVILKGMTYTNGAVFIPDVAVGALGGFQGWGFMDSEFTSGYSCFMNALVYQCFKQLAEMAADNGDAADATDYTNRANTLRTVANAQLFDSTYGLYKMATIKGSGQYDIWGSCFAVYVGLATEEMKVQIAKKLLEKKDTWYFDGGVRHIMTDNEFNPGVSVHETYFKADGTVTNTHNIGNVGTTNNYNQYQNGGYWYTPCLWVWKTIDYADYGASAQMRKDAIARMRIEGSNAAFEWFNQSMSAVSRYVASTMGNAYFAS